MADEDISRNSMRDVHGIAFQAHEFHGNVYVNSTPTTAERVPCAPPRSWAETTALPAEIEHLLWAQEQTADLLPYELPGARTPTLGTVYVRQDLGGGVENTPADHTRPAPMLDERGQLVEDPVTPSVRVTVRPPSKPMRAALDADSHVLVLGGPGQGKSTLTLRLAADIIRNWSQKSDGEDAPLCEPVVPLRVTARVLAQNLGSSFTQALADSAFAEYGRYLSGPLDPAPLADRVNGCRWLLLVDALDEVADSALRATLVHTLASWARRSTYRVLLTTRPTEGGTLAALQRAGATRYELQPFDAEALHRFAVNWFADVGDQEADRFLWQIREAHLDELAEVPLLATIAAVVFEQYRQQPLPGNQYELYVRYLDYIKESRPADEICEPHREALTEHLGRVRLSSDTSLAVAALDWAGQHDVAQPENLIAYVAKVGPFTRRGEDIAFLHHSFAEHVAATATARELPTEFAPEHHDFAELLHTAQPWEGGRFARAVLLHYTHLNSGEADRVLRHLHGGGAQEHLLGARLLSRHMPACTPLVTDFLGTARIWAMTTQSPARLILRETSRATRHPGLVEWLADLLHTDSAPLESKVEAAIALAIRLQCVHTDAAVAFICSVLDDPGARINDRLMAAEALAHRGSREREAAERGLRSVLGDSFASGAESRSAAVVLSAFGGEAKRFAVSSLQTLVTNEYVSTSDLVEITTGLLEIDAEFHDQCREVFLSVLRDQVDNSSGRRDAAIGLASLGARDAAAEALMATLANRSLSSGVRTSAASTLALLGRHHRVAAAELLLAELDPAVAAPIDRVVLPTTLAHLGYRDQAVATLREVLADRSTNWNYVISAARSLLELGPRFRDEAAAHLEQALSELPSEGYNYASALQLLADCADPHRVRAIVRMRELVADTTVDATTRCQLAASLTSCAPEHQAEVVGHLLAITRFERDPDVLSAAWQQLRWFGSDLRIRAVKALAVLAKEHQQNFEVPDDLGMLVSTCCAADRVIAADLLRTVALDAELVVQARVSATRGLARLGTPCQRDAAEMMRDLIKSGSLTQPSFPVRYFTGAGRGTRMILADALYESLRKRDGVSDRDCADVTALRVLGFRVPADALRGIIRDATADVRLRIESALSLAREDPAHLAEAADIVIGACENILHENWRAHTVELARLGLDLRSRLRQVVSDPSARVSGVATAAWALGSEGRDVLRRQAEDPYLEAHQRIRAYELLASSDRAESPEAIEYVVGVVNDPDESIDDRSVAAYRLVRLDRSRLAQMSALFWRWAGDRLLIAEERAWALMYLSNLESVRPQQVMHLFMGLCHDPGLSATLRKSLSQWLARPERTAIELVMLADHSSRVDHRVPYSDGWAVSPLVVESESAVRDVLAAPTSTRRERRLAAVELGRLSERLAPEAVRLLLADGSPAALADAAKLGAWKVVRERALTVVRDEARSARERRVASMLVCSLSGAKLVRDHLFSDQSASWRDRVDVLEHVGAHDDLRTLRDDPAGLPAQRWRAAGKLIDILPEDRAAAVRVYRAIAVDVTARPALRWRAADDLAGLGERGREEGIRLLRELAIDESLPIIARSDAASALRKRCASARREALTIQRGLLVTQDPLQRIEVLRAIGPVASGEAVDGLLEMAGDRRLSAAARLRCVRNVVTLRRDHLGRCAVVAREVAFDPAVDWHVRLLAAKCLSDWSEVMRDDARALANELRREPPRKKCAE